MTQTSCSELLKVSPEKYHAVIFDMDGVVTQTAKAHAAAWKKMFDNFLQNRAKATKAPFIPFDAEDDYLRFVDGKPRFEGIISFLQSRAIELPMGDAGDGPEKETVYGLGRKKNDDFQETIRTQGVDVFPTTVEFIEKLKKLGIKVGIISSSKNCREVLQSAGVLNLFDVRVDGVYTEKHNIKGKPEPDIFLEAAKQLGVEPQYAMVVEDAISGVEAGSKGGFALCLGIDRSGQRKALLKHGADLVVDDLAELEIISPPPRKDAIEFIDEIAKRIEGKKAAFFFDYDGTLTPIVSRPDLAVLSDAARDALQSLGKIVTVAIISGRDRQNVERLVGVNGIFYAGSHGYDIAGPNGEHFENNEAKRYVPAIDQAEAELKEKLKEVEGSLVERKKYGVAAHYRLVKPEDEQRVASIVEMVHANHHQLRKTIGKKVFELQPKVEWNKGKALHWLLHCLKLNNSEVVPFYLGDDVTDEDAFKALHQIGIGIAVQEKKMPTAALYTLKNPDAVKEFMEKLTQIVQKRG